MTQCRNIKMFIKNQSRMKLQQVSDILTISHLSTVCPLHGAKQTSIPESVNISFFYEQYGSERWRAVLFYLKGNT